MKQIMYQDLTWFDPEEEISVDKQLYLVYI